MSLWVIAVLAVLTYGSRAVALVVMPNPTRRVKAVLDRVPAPLFAALAAISMFEEGQLANADTVFAAVGALIAAPTRSLLWVLMGGMAGYALGAFVF